MIVLCRFKLDLDPPTLTFQDKELGLRTAAGGDVVPTIRKSKALRGAVEHYETLLLKNPARPRVPFAGDLYVRAVFCWPVTGATSIALRPEKPDADNAFKTLADALTAAGYIKDDKMIVHPAPFKLQGPRGWIHVTIGLAEIEDVADVLDELYPEPQRIPAAGSRQHSLTENL